VTVAVRFFKVFYLSDSSAYRCPLGLKLIYVTRMCFFFMMVLLDMTYDSY
jgi:hypothetical protein